MLPAKERDIKKPSGEAIAEKYSKSAYINWIFLSSQN